MIYRRPGRRARPPPNAGAAFLTELYQVHAEVTEELWAGHDDRVSPRLVGSARPTAVVRPGAGRRGAGAGAGRPFAAMAPPYEPDGTPSGVLLLNRLGTLRYHRADAHAAAWAAAGHTASSIAALPRRARTARHRAGDRPRAAGPYAMLSADGAAEHARRPGGAARLTRLAGAAHCQPGLSSSGDRSRTREDVAMIGMVLAAGAGRRLRPYTDTLPKALVPVDGETTILDIALRNLAEVGLTDVVVVVGYRGRGGRGAAGRAGGAARRQAHPGAQRQGRGVEQRLLPVAGPRPLRPGRAAGQRRHRAPGLRRADAARRARDRATSCSPSTTSRRSPTRR